MCGNGRVDEGEDCDDGNSVEKDGCSNRCRIEVGYKCTLSGTPCTLSNCPNVRHDWMHLSPIEKATFHECLNIAFER